MEFPPKKILDLGCGLNKTPGAVCLDKVRDVNPDIVHDLESFPYPFDENVFDEIKLNSVIEHISDVLALMEECHRIAKPGAELEIVTPHYSSSNSWTDPTHKQHLGYFSFDFFTGAEGMIGFYSSKRFEIIHRKLFLHTRHKVFGIEWLANRFPRTWEKFYCYRYPARHMIIKMRVIK